MIRYPGAIEDADKVSGYRGGIYLSLVNIGIAEALDLVVEQAAAKWQINEFSQIEILPKNWTPKLKGEPEVESNEADPFE